jgi:hypothetical protein
MAKILRSFPHSIHGTPRHRLERVFDSHLCVSLLTCKGMSIADDADFCLCLSGRSRSPKLPLRYAHDGEDDAD